jgi:septum formation protein
MNKISELIKNYPYRIILGSASPRRQELMKSLGFPFRVMSLAADESHWPPEYKAQEICIYLAEKKAAAYPVILQKDELLITADTIVWCGGKVYNKPEDMEDGVRMLKSLSGRMHQVFTAVCFKAEEKEFTFVDESKVFFKKFSDEEIRFYLENYKPFDKAGAYGVQEWLGYIGIEKIEGSFYNVMGLPVKLVYEQLMKML